MYNIDIMDRISATEARQNWSELLDKGLHEPVTIMRNGREVAMLMPITLANRALDALEDIEDQNAAQEAHEADSWIPFEQVLKNMNLPENFGDALTPEQARQLQEDMGIPKRSATDSKDQ